MVTIRRETQADASAESAVQASRFSVPSRLLAAWVACHALVAAALTPPDSARPLEQVVVRQEKIGDMACGPCAVCNMIAWGSQDLRQCGATLPGETPDQRASALIEKYGSRASMTYLKGRNRYTAEHGIVAEDLCGFINDFLGEHGTVRVQGDYLDRTKDEPPGDHLRRVHSLLSKSLKDGVPPIVDLRSFVARPAGWDYKWEGLMGHFVAVIGIDPAIEEGESGFRFRYADSYTGLIETAHVHVERARNFSATRAFSVSPDGMEQWEWITDYPYLVVTSPSLRLLTQKEPWHARTMIVLRYAVVAQEPRANGE